jgi:putative tryptophan/tyrosine transport system substrate-binding protein
MTVAAGLVVAPLAAEAQQAAKVHRVGFLGGAPVIARPFVTALEEGLRERGYILGKNIIIEYRSDSGKDAAGRAALVAELIGLKIDVLVTSLTQRAMIAKQVTRTIPIVVVNAGDPVESGLVASLARPGGNVTGLSRAAFDLVGKNLELLKEAVPGATRVAVLSDPSEPLSPALRRNVSRAAGLLGVQLTVVEAGSREALEGAFATMNRQHVSAVLVLGSAMFYRERTRIAELALRRRLPSMSANSEIVQAGGLMSYAPNSIEPYRQAAAFVDKILKGAKAADLPMEQPTKFELVINLKTANTLGLTIPPSLRLRADQVIE